MEKYEKIKVIGQGAFGLVVSAVSVGIARSVYRRRASVCRSVSEICTGITVI